MIKYKAVSFLIILSLLVSFRINSQPKFTKTKISIIKQDFVPILDSLIKPPINCEEAWKFVIYDSSKINFVLTIDLLIQDKRIQKLSEEINNGIIKSKPDNSQMPSGNSPAEGSNPPGGIGPPVGMNMPDVSQEIIEDMDDVNKAVDKNNILKEKFKNELTGMQVKLNERLHKTLENEYDEHINILNEFFKSSIELYEKYLPLFKANMKKIDDVIKKYDYGTRIKFPPLKKDILNLQSVQVDVLMFLFNITKEFVLTGARFYNEKLMNMN